MSSHFNKIKELWMDLDESYIMFSNKGIVKSKADFLLKILGHDRITKKNSTVFLLNTLSNVSDTVSDIISEKIKNTLAVVDYLEKDPVINSIEDFVSNKNKEEEESFDSVVNSKRSKEEVFLELIHPRNRLSFTKITRESKTFSECLNSPDSFMTEVRLSDNKVVLKSLLPNISKYILILKSDQTLLQETYDATSVLFKTALKVFDYLDKDNSLPDILLCVSKEMWEKDDSHYYLKTARDHKKLKVLKKSLGTEGIGLGSVLAQLPHKSYKIAVYLSHE